SRSSYFATFRHQLTILSKTDALDEEKWLNMLGTFVKDWFRYESHFVHGRDSLVDIFTLSQSPMLGFHKQMDNRIKLLEEILSFRMQGVEFDNGDMYVDGHKAASDVRDEFVSVTEKLMDELAQCYNVLPQLDINNT